MRENKWLTATDDELQAALDWYAEAEDKHGSHYPRPGMVAAVADRFRRLRAGTLTPSSTAAPESPQ